jgi:predicted phage terminase large subunit-like protein
VLIDHLQALADGQIRKLMVFMPPGAAKSSYGSVLFPPWFMGHPNGGNIIAGAHNAQLAQRFSRKVRGLASDHRNTLGYGLRETAVELWSTSGDREYLAAGVGVGIAGFRAKLGSVDDPIRSRQDADSKLVRDRIWGWYEDDFENRLIPGASQLIINTRWHEDDLSGRLIERDGLVSEANPDGWDVLSIPALAGTGDPLGRAPGQYLWDDDPDYSYGARLRERHAVLDTRSWSALYQQEPTPDTGDFFRAEWLIPVDSSPRDAKQAAGAYRFYGASDYAVTSQGGDYTVHVVVGLDADDNPWLVDLWRAQAASDEWVDALCDLVKKWRPLEWAEETGQIKAGVGPYRARQMRERKAYCVMTQFPTRGDKATRAQSFRAMIASRGLRVPAGAAWRTALESEMLRFPAGVHDDQVDALGLIGQLLDKALAAAPPKKPDKSDETGYAVVDRTGRYGDDLMGD